MGEPTSQSRELNPGTSACRTALRCEKDHQGGYEDGPTSDGHAWNCDRWFRRRACLFSMH